MTYPEVLQYLYDKLPMFHRVGDQAYKKDLTNTLALCKLLNNPHHKLKVIHVAGTNGKGSTSHLIASMLQSMGYQVGLYTSPHYIDFRERIKINGTLINEEAVVEFIQRYREDIEAIKPSFFEVTVALAFDYFAQQHVDFAVIEVGLGGRLDSTNVVDPLVSVITNIGWDHMQFLGNTLQAIAGEKAGIIKHKVPVVIGEPSEEIKSVFEEKASAMQAALFDASKMIKLKTIEQDQTKRKVMWKPTEQDSEFIFEIPFSADYQMANVKTAISTLQTLHAFYPLPNYSFQKIIEGIQQVYQQTYFIGRWMCLQQHPTIILDSAHNEHGLRPVFHQLNQQQGFHQKHIVFGTVADKEIELIVDLLPADAIYYFVAADIPRAMKASVLQQNMQAYRRIGKAYDSVLSGFQAAKQAAQKNDLVLVIGSIFVVGELLADINQT